MSPASSVSTGELNNDDVVLNGTVSNAARDGPTLTPTVSNNLKTTLASSKLESQRLGVAINEKQVLKDISNISAATTLSLGKSVEEIAKAATTARALGLELSTIEGISDNILNFEQSIEKELQAELLLGKGCVFS